MMRRGLAVLSVAALVVGSAGPVRGCGSDDGGQSPAYVHVGDRCPTEGVTAQTRSGQHVVCSRRQGLSYPTWVTA
jgi:hypothetical protein